jgi:hypothetical protein
MRSCRWGPALRTLDEDDTDHPHAPAPGDRGSSGCPGVHRGSQRTGDDPGNLWKTAFRLLGAATVCRVTTPALADVPVRSSLALTRRWVALLAPLSVSGRTLWLTWLGPDGRQSPVLAPVADIPIGADRRLATGLLDVHAEVARSIPGNDVHLAMALARPGDPAVTEDDDEWASAFHDVLDSALDGTWSLHLAAGGRVEPVVQSPNFFVRSAGRRRARGVEDGLR